MLDQIKVLLNVSVRSEKEGGRSVGREREKGDGMNQVASVCLQWSYSGIQSV